MNITKMDDYDIVKTTLNTRTFNISLHILFEHGDLQSFSNIRVIVQCNNAIY